MFTASLLLLIATLAGYALLCAMQPFGACRKCRGFGVRTLTDRKGRPKPGKTCRRCKGHGKRIRVGVRLLNHSRTTYRAGTR